MDIPCPAKDAQSPPIQVRIRIPSPVAWIRVSDLTLKSEARSRQTSSNGCKTEFGYGLGGEGEAVVAGSVGVESLLPELIGAATAVDAA